MTRARDLSNLIGSGNYSQTTLTATAGQTSFTVSHTPNFVQVFMNGLLLDPTVDFTANGTAIVLTEAAAVGDELEVVTYETFSVGDAITQTEADTRYVLDTADVITVSGSNVGVGTASPSGAKLQVTGSNYNDQLVIERTDTSSKWGLAGTDSGGFQIYDVNSSNATRMTIDSSGNVGIGTDSPNSSLTVGSNSHGVSLDYVGALPSGAGMFTSSQAHTAQAYGDLNIKARSDYAGYGVGLYTASSANSPQLRLKVDSAGRVTMPYQPCFVATRSGDHTVTSDAVVPLDSVDVNVGNHFNTTTYTFTAPVGGKYLFTLQTTLNNVNSGSYNAIYILRNGGGTGYRFRTLSGSGWTGINGSAILSLNANDSIKINAYAASGSMTIQGSEIHFGGYLVG